MFHRSLILEPVIVFKMFMFLVKCFDDMEYLMEGEKIKDYFPLIFTRILVRGLLYNLHFKIDV